MNETVPDDPAFVAQGADLALTHPDGETTCWLWWSVVPTLPDERPGVIGHYHATTVGAGRAVLDAACERLTAQGCTLAVGPMDGNTWRHYRFVTGGDPDESPFFLEPTNQPEYPDHWRAAGFTPLAGYRSALTTDLGWTDERLPRVRARVEKAGLTLRPLATGSVSEAEADLRAVYALTLVAFADNFLYTPLEAEAFLAQYRPLLPVLRPELTVLAHDGGGNLVGYLFALSDANEAKRGAPVRTLVIKTLAVAPGRTWAGLGSLLTDHCQKAARDAGFVRSIHALMYDSNKSRNLSEGYAGRLIREYTLFSRRLGAG